MSKIIAALVLSVGIRCSLSFMDNISIPTIMELSGEWNEAVPLRGIGPVQNFIGSVGIRGSPYQGTRRSDMVSLSQIIFSPFDGNMINSSMKLISDSNDDIYLHMNETKWSPCQVSRRTNNISYNNISLRVTNDVRLGFEKRLILSKYTMESTPNNPNTPLQFEFNLTGPLFQLCGIDLVTYSGISCGWGVTLPIRQEFYKWETINDTIGVVTFNNNTNVKGYISIVSYDMKNNIKYGNIKVGNHNNFIVNLNAVVSDEIVLIITFGDDNFPIINITEYFQYETYINEYNSACELWQKRWEKAFEPKNDHFSGNLPKLVINDSKVERMYYSGALSIISLERTNLNISNRTYTISQGNPSQLAGNSSMGGSGQFTWDLSFTSVVLTILDPESTKDVLRFIIRNSKFFTEENRPFLVPQLWDAWSQYSYGQSTPYMFDYVTAFQFISTYIRITNDYEFLDERLQIYGSTINISVKEYLVKLANVYRIYQTINGTIHGLTNYGGNLRCFLEVIPTYIHAIPALNYGNAYMLLSLSELLGNETYRQDGINIINLANKYMYNNDGTFNCLYPNGSIVNVRTIADYVYISQYLGIFIPREGGGINDPELLTEINEMMYEMNQFAMNELYVNDSNWFRSLSLNDSIYYPDNLLIMRADWGIGGSYPGLDGMIVESLAIGDNNYTRSIEFYRNAELVTHKGSMSQGIAVYTPNSWLNGTKAAQDMNYNMYRPPPIPPYQPGWPEYFEDGSYWPETLRDIANVAASFNDAMIRTLFGFNPIWNGWNKYNTSNDFNAIFDDINKSREFDGYLIGLKTPFGYMDLYASLNGINIINITV